MRPFPALPVFFGVIAATGSNGFVLRSNHAPSSRFASGMDLLWRVPLYSLPSRANNNDNSPSPPMTQTEWDRLVLGYNDIASGEAFDGSHLSKLGSVEDIIGTLALVPLSLESLHTAVTGEIIPENYAACAAATALCGLAHWKMTSDQQRDYRAPRLAEYRTVYEFSALYLLPFAWFLWRITPSFPPALEAADFVGCLLLSAVTLYGFLFAIYGKGVLKRVNEDPNYGGILQPSDEAYRAQADLYLTGNIAINSLACLFLPFAWTLAIRGTEWWERVQQLHTAEGAFLGVSILVAIVGDVSGNLLLRLEQLGIIKSQQGIVVMGIVSNFALLVFPELVFNVIYHAQISEIGFYWE